MNKLNRLESILRDRRRFEEPMSTHVSSKIEEVRQEMLDIINEDDPTGEAAFEKWCPANYLEA